jgi:hypothetical protein
MTRLTQIDDVLFPITERPIFVSLASPAGDKWKPVSNKKAIVNASSGRVVGVVSHNYQLVTNRQALDWALQCCRTVFPETKVSEWEVTTIDAPSTAGYCRIDLMHSLAKLNFSFPSPKGRPDVFGPFIRVTNSYNGLRALAVPTASI